MVRVRNFRAILPDVKAALQATEKEELERDYHQKLARISVPLAELAKIITVYNKYFFSKTVANLWMYFGSTTGRLENTGHVEFIKGSHSIDTYLGTPESEFLLPERQEYDGAEGDFVVAVTSDISTLPLLMKRVAIEDVLQRAVNVSEDGKVALRSWISETTPPGYSPNFIKRHIPWNAPQLGGEYSQTTQWSIDYLNHHMGYVQTYNFFNNPMMTMTYHNIDSADAKASLRNATLESQYKSKLEALCFPMAALQRVVDLNREIFINGETDHTWEYMFSGETVKSGAIQSSGTTIVTEQTIEGAGKIQAGKHKYHDLDQIMPFSLFGDVEVYHSTLPASLPTFSGDISVFVNSIDGIVNSTNIILPGAYLFLNLHGKDFTNTGIIVGRKFILGGCELFKNENEIISIGDSRIRAERIISTCEPRSQAVLSPNLCWLPNAVSIYGMNMELYKKHFGQAKLVSQEGSITLEAGRFIENHYGYILSKTGFNFLSAGMFVNHTGYVHSSGTAPSYIKALSLHEYCDDRNWMLFGHPCLWRGWHQHIGYDASEKPVIYSGGDVHLEITESPFIEGGDIFAGGNIVCAIPTSRFAAVNVGNNFPTIAAGEHIIVNGENVSITGSLFLAGLGISLTASGAIVITNPNGHQSVIPPHTTVDVSLTDAVKTLYPALINRPTLTNSVFLQLDPTAGMRRLFFGNLPRKKLVFDPQVMGAIPMVLGSMLDLFGTNALDTQNFLTLLDRNAGDLSVPLVLANTMPNQPILYFKLKDIDDETQEAEPYLHITQEMIQNAITSSMGIISERGPVEMQATDIILDRAKVRGTVVGITAKKAPSVSSGTGRITAVASRLCAKELLHLQADGGLHTNAAFDVTEHITRGKNEYTRIQTATIHPSFIEAPKILLEGGSSAVRGTIVKAKQFIDSTEH